MARACVCVCCMRVCVCKKTVGLVHRNCTVMFIFILGQRLWFCSL